MLVRDRIFLDVRLALPVGDHTARVVPRPSSCQMRAQTAEEPLDTATSWARQSARPFESRFMHSASKASRCRRPISPRRQRSQKVPQPVRANEISRAGFDCRSKFRTHLGRLKRHPKLEARFSSRHARPQISRVLASRAVPSRRFVPVRSIKASSSEDAARRPTETLDAPPPPTRRTMRDISM